MDEGEKDCLLCSKESTCELHQKKDENNRNQGTNTSQICHLVVDGVDGLKSHPVPRNFKCNICSKVFFEKSTLINHMTEHFKVKKFTCYICSKRFNQKDNMTDHIKMHTKVKCPICGKEFYKKAGMICHMKIHSNVKEFKCHICGKEFLQKVHMKTHMKIHNGGEKMNEEFKCFICSKAFVNKDYMIKHRETHLEYKKFKCHLCNKAFVHKPQFMKHLNKAHLNKAHTSKNEFKCELCGKEFMHLWALMKHTAVHSKLLPNVNPVPHIKRKEFRCHHCGREYTREFNLKKHLLSHNDHMIIANNSSTITKEEDLITMKSEPEKDPLAIEDEIPPLVEEERSDSNLLEETPSVFKSGNFIGSEFPVKLESNLDDEDFEKNKCKSGDVKLEIVKEEEYIDCDH